MDPTLLIIAVIALVFVVAYAWFDARVLLARERHWNATYRAQVEDLNVRLHEARVELRQVRNELNTAWRARKAEAANALAAGANGTTKREIRAGRSDDLWVSGVPITDYPEPLSPLFANTPAPPPFVSGGGGDFGGGGASASYSSSCDSSTSSSSSDSGSSCSGGGSD